MLADNSADFGKLCSKVLEERGFTVITCDKDGVKVQEYIDSFEPDVVVLDIVLPSVDAIGVMAPSKVEARRMRPLFCDIGIRQSDGGAGGDSRRGGVLHSQVV